MAPHSDHDLAQSGARQGKVTIAFLALSWLFILVRIPTRVYIISNFGWDDATMILAGLTFTVCCAALIYIADNGGGTHVTGIPLLQRLTKWVIISEAAYIMTMMIVKISLGIFFARIVAKRWHFLLIYITVGVNILSSFFAFFFALFRCGPNVDDYVMQQMAKKCTPDRLNLFVAYQQAAFTTLTDIVFVILPGLILWNSNMSRRSKLSVGAIMALATVGCICSVLRFRFVDGLARTDDFFWHAVNIAMWSSIECGTCIMAGCLATLRPLAKRVIEQSRSSSRLSGYMKTVSRPLRSMHHPTSNVTPHCNTTTSSLGMSSMYKSGRSHSMDGSTCLELLATSGSDGMPLEHNLEDHKKSIERAYIPRRQVESDQASQIASDQSERRVTMHAIRTLGIGFGSDGRTAERRWSAPLISKKPGLQTSEV